MGKRNRNKDLKKVSPVIIQWHNLPVVCEEQKGGQCNWTWGSSIVVD